MNQQTLDKINSIHTHVSHSMSESHALYAFAYLSRLYGNIIEIGSALGRSAIILASATDKNVYCIDPWDNTIWSGITTPEYKDVLNNDSLTSKNVGDKVYEKFLENTKDFKNIISLRGTHYDFHTTEKIGMVFIDGGHHYEDVKADIMFSLSLNPKLVLLHDWYHDLERGVERACEDTFKRNPDLIIESLAVYIL